MSDEHCPSGLCPLIGFQSFSRENSKKLKDRFAYPEGSGKKTRQKERKKKERIINCYALGQGVKTKDVNETVDILCQRDLPQIANMSENEKTGAIFVPPGFIPKYPRVINPKTSKVLNDQDLKIEQDKTEEGDLAERHVYETLTELFCDEANKNAKTKDKSVLVLQGLKMLEIDPKERRVTGHKHEQNLIS